MGGYEDRVVPYSGRFQSQLVDERVSQVLDHEHEVAENQHREVGD